MKNVRFNADFKIDNTVFTSGQEVQLTAAQFAIVEPLDVSGMNKELTKAAPLVTVIENKKPDEKK